MKPFSYYFIELLILINHNNKDAGVAELADALDLESSSERVQVRFLSPAPLK